LRHPTIRSLNRVTMAFSKLRSITLLRLRSSGVKDFYMVTIREVSECCVVGVLCCGVLWRGCVVVEVARTLEASTKSLDSSL